MKKGDKMETIVISLGGSIIVPKNIDYNYVKDFKKIISSDRRKFVIVTGGGGTARDYISALRKQGASNKRQDNIGIEITRLNAKLVAGVFNLSEKIPENVKQVKSMWKKQRITLCGGFRPGITTDGVAAEIAKEIKAQTLINITNVAGLYTKDPKLKGAKFIPEIKYRDFQKFLDKFNEKPGQHFVLDKYAAKIAKANKIRVVILKGIENLRACLSEKTFKGTIIH
jgi:uridylate kinase